MLYFTDKSIKKIEGILSSNKDKCLRVFVRGGGCSGFQYGFFIENIDDVPSTDLRVSCGEISLVVVDKESLEFLAESTIDYEESLTSSGFKIENPNAAASCGCGKSFSPKDTGGCAGCD